MYGQPHPFALALLREGVGIFDRDKQQPEKLSEWMGDVDAYLASSEFVSPGLDLVAMERFEQIGKHGRTLEMDKELNSRGQLRKAAMYCLTLIDEHWPADWPHDVRDNIYSKGQKERYIIAAALLVAEVDRFCFVDGGRFDTDKKSGQ